MNRTERLSAYLITTMGAAALALTIGSGAALAGPVNGPAAAATASAPATPIPAAAQPTTGGDPSAAPMGFGKPSNPLAPAPAPPSTPAAAEPANEPLKKATALARQGKFKEAIAELEAQRQKGGAPSRSLSLLGTLYLQIGKPAEAMAILRPLADASDAEPATLFQAGRAELLLHHLPAAQAYFQRSLALEPASPSARELGLILAHQGKVVEAYAMLRPWAVRNTTDGEALLTAAALAVDLERPGEAAQMIAGMPQNDPAIALLRAKILIEQGDGVKSAALLTPLLDKHPPGMEPEVRRSLAEADLLAGQPDRAVALLNGRVGNHPSVALVLAKAERRTGGAVAALATLKPFVDQLPAEGAPISDPRIAGAIASEYGQLLTETGHVPEGVGFLQRGTQISPNSKEAWQALAQGLTTAGRKDEAQKASAKASALAQAGVKTGG